jgi:hypothetical protein
VFAFSLAEHSLDMWLTRRKNLPVWIGSRYPRRDLPHAVCQVLAIYSGIDDRDHAVPFNVDDTTWHKTLTVAERTSVRKRGLMEALGPACEQLERSREPSVYRKEPR